MKISASIYSNGQVPLQETIAVCERNAVDLLHVDCNDDPSVFGDIAQIRQMTQKPIDLHLITPKPSQYYDRLKAQPVEMVTLQYEVLEEPVKLPNIPGTKWGMAVTTPTDISVFEDFAEHFDFILIMATVPGQSGGQFDKSNFHKIREFAQRYPNKRIHVDGGVNAEVSFIIRNMGVYAAVSGSYLFKADEMGTALFKLKADEIESHFLVKDFMRSRQELPILLPYQRSFKEVLLSIEQYKLGFTILADEDYRLQGIISNADVRRGLIKNMDNIARTVVDDMINDHPTTVSEDLTVAEMIRFIKAQSFPISFLPVVNSFGQVSGALTFFNLIKGEF